MADKISEREIRRTLRRIARQRVVATFQDGEVWAVVHTVKLDDKRAEAVLNTCYLRGWVEIEGHSVPVEALEGEGNDRHLPETLGRLPRSYRLTGPGWSAIEQTHAWVVATCIVASVGLALTIVGLLARSC